MGKNNRQPVRPRVRGDDIPSVTEYAHHGEEAHAVWYAENRYDMEHWDEPIEYDDDYDGGQYDDE